MQNSKTANTRIPLSPEEMEEASRLFGSSLFSAMQLAREQEARRSAFGRNPESGDDSTLRIPIPASLTQSNKLASSVGEPAYTGLTEKDTGEIEASPGEGDLSHFKRNSGKYLGGQGGAALGAILGAVLNKNPSSRASIAKYTGLGGAAGGVLGTSVGDMMDKARRDKYIKEVLINSLHPSPTQEDTEKAAEDDMQNEPPGILARTLSTQSDPIRMLIHGQQGFRDSRQNYYMQQKEQIQKELAHAQKEYIELLSKIKTGSENDTPCVDAFCNGMAYATLFGKKAADNDVDIESGSVSRFLGELLQKAKSPIQPAIDTAASGLANTAAGTAYLTYLMRKRMREQPDKFMEDQLPTRVELQPYQ